MDRFLLAVFLCVSWTSIVFAVDSWSYTRGAADGPENWTGTCKTGTKQSPIAIKSADTEYAENLGSFTLKNYNLTPSNVKFTATNNGNISTIVFKFPPNIYNVSGGGLGDVYTTVQFHLHWGSDNNNGSEHTLNGKEFAAELHFVSYNTKYSNFDAAVSKPDGLAVLGVFIEVGDTKDNKYFSFLDYAKNLTADSSKSGIIDFKLQSILPPTLNQYFRYNGSLTIPRCDESVTWTIFKDAVKISQAQMDILRALKDNASQPLSNNYRPIQKLNNRVVKNSFLAPSTHTATPTNTAARITKAGTSIVNTNFGLFLLLLYTALFGYLKLFVVTLE